MITLNIAPASLKKKNKTNELFQMLKSVYYLIMLSIGFFIIILIISYALLNDYASKTKSQSYTITKNTEDYSKKANEINVHLAEIETIQSDYVEWSKLIKFFSLNHNNNINIQSININKSDNTLRLSGQAKNRDDLLGLQKKINESGIFEEAVLPFSNLVKETNISFEIIANFKNYEFSKLE